MTDTKLQRTYVDVHVLQTLPPSNINRDDTGSPKHALYGGVRRARVSSQAWKRAARMHLADRQPEEMTATRTKRLVALIAAQLLDRASLEEKAAKRIAVALLARSGITMEKDKKRQEQTAYLLFFGKAQVTRIVDAIVDRAAELAAASDKELSTALADVNVPDILATGHPLDVMLFGRMVADLADLNVDAATQVAHAISTHAVDIEYDYFTAVDDENTASETGAGMIGTVAFNAATYYRYATIAAHRLSDELPTADDVAAACRAFVEAFVKAVPSGHQNSFAHGTRPSLVLVVVRTDQPVNLVTAFEAPVTSREGLELASIQRLAGELTASTTMWGDAPALVVASHAEGDSDETLSAFGAPVPFDGLLDALGKAVLARLAPVSA